MLCITGNERTAAAWRKRVEDSDERCRRAGIALSLQELRLDALEEVDDATFDLLAAHRFRTVVCCRPARQGGQFGGAEAERLALLGRAARAGACWLDVEADLTDESVTQLATAARAAGGEIILSWHDYDSIPLDLPKRVAAMRALRPGAIKIAVAVHDAAEIEELLASFAGDEGKRIAIAMGPAGLLSRTHYSALGSMWTYVAASAEASTAPGQVDLDRALAMGMPASCTRPVAALAGGPQILHSPGPTIYNRFFRAREQKTAYVPVLTQRLAAILPLFERIGVVGISVTMPLKTEALSVCEPDPLARAVGAANSLRLREGWQGTNTDVAGFQAQIGSLLARQPIRRAVVLGAGGAARAAVIACERLGLDVEVYARTPDRSRFSGHPIKIAAWNERTRAHLGETVLINATPLTGSQSPWPDASRLNAAAVLDTAIDQGGSRLLDRARGAGAAVVGPMALWFAQGAAQMSWFLDQRVSVTQLEALAL